MKELKRLLNLMSMPMLIIFGTLWCIMAALACFLLYMMISLCIDRPLIGLGIISPIIIGGFGAYLLRSYLNSKKDI